MPVLFAARTTEARQAMASASEYSAQVCHRRVNHQIHSRDREIANPTEAQWTNIAQTKIVFYHKLRPTSAQSQRGARSVQCKGGRKTYKGGMHWYLRRSNL